MVEAGARASIEELGSGLGGIDQLWYVDVRGGHVGCGANGAHL